MNSQSSARNIVQFTVALWLFLPTLTQLQAQAPPGILSYQGRLIVNGVNYDGTGFFKFSLVQGTNGPILWSNDGTVAGEPGNTVPLPVLHGLYNVLLGDTTDANLQGMTASIPANVFTNADVRLRVWFGTTAAGTFDLLAPDNRIASVGYSMMAARLAPGAIQSDQLPANPEFTGVVTASGGFSGPEAHFDDLTATNISSEGNLILPPTSPATGVIYLGDTSFLHAYGGNNTFVGSQAGNFTMLDSATNNTGLGFRALQSNLGGDGNTAVGANALSLNSTGYANTAVGASALEFSTNGIHNTAVGVFALQFNKGSGNTASGVNTLRFNSTGAANTAVGEGALENNTTGLANAAYGAGALHSNTYGAFNTASGWEALSSNKGDNMNTAIGERALQLLHDGVANSAVGSQALAKLGSGFGNLALGGMAGSSLIAGNSNIYIASFGSAIESQTIRLGGNTHTDTYIAGISSAIVPGGVPVYVRPDGKLGTEVSSRRFKRDIQDMGAASDVLLDLRPVTFRYKEEIDPEGHPQFGLVAEEVEKVAPELVLYDADGVPQNVRYEAVNAMLLNEFQKQNREVQRQSQTIGELRHEVGDLNTRLGQLTSLVDQLRTQLERGTFNDVGPSASLNAASR